MQIKSLQAIEPDVLTEFLAAHGIPVTGRQFEMVREL